MKTKPTGRRKTTVREHESPWRKYRPTPTFNAPRRDGTQGQRSDLALRPAIPHRAVPPAPEWMRKPLAPPNRRER